MRCLITLSSSAMHLFLWCPVSQRHYLLLWIIKVCKARKQQLSPQPRSNLCFSLIGAHLQAEPMGYSYWLKINHTPPQGKNWNEITTWNEEAGAMSISPPLAFRGKWVVVITGWQPSIPLTYNKTGGRVEPSSVHVCPCGGIHTKINKVCQECLCGIRCISMSQMNSSIQWTGLWRIHRGSRLQVHHIQ